MQAAVSGKNILIMAAGTGGHIFPALAVARDLQAKGMNVFWLATPDGMENRLVGPTQIPLYPINIAGVRGNGIKRLLKAPFQVMHATLDAMQIMKSLHIDAVAGFGGYVAGPGGLAAKLQGLPLVIQEQNAVAGLTNRLLARIATRVCQAFPNSFNAVLPDTSSKVLTTGNPIRSDFISQPPPLDRFKDRAGPLVIQIVGGSLGAKALNEIVPKALSLLKTPLIVRHQCGRDHVDATQAIYQKLANPNLQVTVSPFIDDMATAYSEADLVVCRAGASTISELAAIGTPSLLVPLPIAVDDHQTANARYLADQEAAILMPQKQMTSEYLAQELASILNREVLKEMAIKAQKMALNDATSQVADAIIDSMMSVLPARKNTSVSS